MTFSEHQANLTFLFVDKYTSQFGNQSSVYSYYHDEDESSFQLVDTSRVQKPIYQRGKFRFNQVGIIITINILKNDLGIVSIVSMMSTEIE